MTPRMSSPAPRGFFQKTHGASKTVEHRIWRGIIDRCECKTHRAYAYYQGRGIGVCERWRDFSNFIVDMGLRPTPQHSIERIDNNGNYDPSNCCWATKTAQQINRRDSIWWIIDGVEYESMPAAAAVYGVCPQQIGVWCKGRVFKGRYYPPKPNCSFRPKYDPGPNDGHRSEHPAVELAPGKAKGERNAAAKLTTTVVKEIKKRLSSGQRQIDIAAAYGVKQSAISSIKVGKSWSHVA